MNKEKYIKVIEGAVSRKMSSILHQKEYLNRLEKYINEETNEHIKAEKIKRYNDEMEILKAWEDNFNYFINVKMIEYFNKHNIDYSEHILQNII